MTTSIMAVPHLFEPIDPPDWMMQLFLAGVAVYFLDLWADKIPGVKGINRLPQILTLFSIATAMSMLLDTKLLGSLTDQLANGVEGLGTGVNAAWNLLGLVLAGIGLAVLALRYMGSEKIFWDGILFGVGFLVAAALVPWLGDGLEFWRFSVVTGIQNLFIYVLGFAFDRTIS